MIREIVNIDEAKCDGCGLCVPNCHEGALQIIDGKARLISDLMCDGLGACIGHCPQGAITIEKREAEPYDEVKVMAQMITQGQNVVVAHLKHLKEHNETGFLKQGVGYLKQNESSLPFNLKEVLAEVHNSSASSSCSGGGCPGSASQSFSPQIDGGSLSVSLPPQSALTHWPVQMHLINPAAGHFVNSDIVVAADCVAFSIGDFHARFLSGKTLAIACPKLDSNQQIYADKLVALIDSAQVNTITVVIMEVPCCGGLLQLVKHATNNAKRKVPVKAVVVSVKGAILSEEWV